MRQARTVIWNSLRQANKITNFDQITANESQIFLPNILVDYLNCRWAQLNMSKIGKSTQNSSAYEFGRFITLEEMHWKQNYYEKVLIAL